MKKEIPFLIMVVTSFMLALALTLVVIQKSREPDQVTLTFYHQDDIIYVDLKRLEVRFEVEDTVIKARDLVHLAGIVEEVSSDLTLLSLFDNPEEYKTYQRYYQQR